MLLAGFVGVVGVVESMRRHHRPPEASVGNVCSETDHRSETRRNPNKFSYNSHTASQQDMHFMPRSTAKTRAQPLVVTVVAAVVVVDDVVVF